MVFQKVNPSEFKFENVGDFIEGIYVTKKSNTGPNKANLYTINCEGVLKNVWGSTILDDKMSLVSEGQIIRITYTGLGEAKPDQNPPKIFEVEYDDGQ